MLHSAVRTFAEDLQTISETIKQRTVVQIKTALKKKVSMGRIFRTLAVVASLNKARISYSCEKLVL